MGIYSKIYMEIYRITCINIYTRENIYTRTSGPLMRPSFVDGNIQLREYMREYYMEICTQNYMHKYIYTLKIYEEPIEKGSK